MRENAEDRPPLKVEPVTGHGGYAVPDPDDASQLTYWWVQRGKIRRYPWGVRWEPTPPLFRDMPREERVALREAWYAETYWPWKLAVVARILEAPEVARRAFSERYPRVELPPRIAAELTRSVAVPKVTPARRVWTALALRAGYSVRSVARQLGVAWQTARDWSTAGEALLTADPVSAQQAVLGELAKGRVTR